MNNSNESTYITLRKGDYEVLLERALKGANKELDNAERQHKLKEKELEDERDRLYEIAKQGHFYREVDIVLEEGSPEKRYMFGLVVKPAIPDVVDRIKVVDPLYLMAVGCTAFKSHITGSASVPVIGGSYYVERKGCYAKNTYYYVDAEGKVYEEIGIISLSSNRLRGDHAYESSLYVREVAKRVTLIENEIQLISKEYVEEVSVPKGTIELINSYL